MVDPAGERGLQATRRNTSRYHLSRSKSLAATQLLLLLLLLPLLLLLLLSICHSNTVLMMITLTCMIPCE